MATHLSVYDGSNYVEIGPGPDGPTNFVRLGTEWLTPRAAGDLIADPNVRTVEWSTGWIYPALLNGWTNFGSGFAQPRYRITPGKVVFLEGVIKGGTVNTSAFILPVGFRPAITLLMGGFQDSSVQNGRMDVSWAGEVIPRSGSGAWFTISQVFCADGV